MQLLERGPTQRIFKAKAYVSLEKRIYLKQNMAADGIENEDTNVPDKTKWRHEKKHIVLLKTSNIGRKPGKIWVNEIAENVKTFLKNINKVCR